MTKIPISTYKMGAPTTSDVLAFHHNFGYVHIMNSGLNKCMYQI